MPVNVGRAERVHAARLDGLRVAAAAAAAVGGPAAALRLRRGRALGCCRCSRRLVVLVDQVAAGHKLGRALAVQRVLLVERRSRAQRAAAVRLCVDLDGAVVHGLAAALLLLLGRRGAVGGVRRKA